MTATATNVHRIVESNSYIKYVWDSNTEENVVQMLELKIICVVGPPTEDSLGKTGMHLGPIQQIRLSVVQSACIKLDVLHKIIRYMLHSVA